MSQIWFAVIAIAFVVFVGFMVYVSLEIRKSARALTAYLKSREPALEELQQTLRSLRNVADNMSEITGDIKTVSGSVKDIGQNIKKVSELVDEVSSEALIRASGLRVGIRTALEVLVKNLFSKGGNQ